MAVQYNGQPVEKIKWNGNEVMGSEAPKMYEIVCVDNAKVAQQKEIFAFDVSLYFVNVGAKSGSYNARALLEGYISGTWETIVDFNTDSVVNDDSNNGGGGTHYGYRSGAITKKYTKYRFKIDSASVYPAWGTCALIS